MGILCVAKGLLSRISGLSFPSRPPDFFSSNLIFQIFILTVDEIYNVNVVACAALGSLIYP